MIFSKPVNVTILSVVLLLTFSLFFVDGFVQWVNSDTAAEACAIEQDLLFPNALFSSKRYHSRITGHLISYLPFHTVGPLYAKITDDRVNSLYFSQGVMTGSIYVLLIIVSSAYISFSSGIFTTRYVLSSVFVMLLIMALEPIVMLKSPLGLSVRFSHQAVLSNYVGTFIFALSALFPYWRYLCTGNWSDLYNSKSIRTAYYCLLLASAFSSSGTTIWLLIMSTFILLFLLYYEYTLHGDKVNIWSFFRRNNIFHPLIFMISASCIAILAESTTKRGQGSFHNINVSAYSGKLLQFLTSGTFLFYVTIVIIIAALIYISFKFKTEPHECKKIYIKLYIAFIAANIIYITVIGIPETPYRFGQYNLGRDTYFPAIWSTFIISIAIIFNYFRSKIFITTLSLLSLYLAFNAVNFFSFPYYVYRKDQIPILNYIDSADKSMPVDQKLFVPWPLVSFSKEAFEGNTLPMLRNAGILSPKRQIVSIP